MSITELLLVAFDLVLVVLATEMVDEKDGGDLRFFLLSAHKACTISGPDTKKATQTRDSDKCCCNALPYTESDSRKWSEDAIDATPMVNKRQVSGLI